MGKIMVVKGRRGRGKGRGVVELMEWVGSKVEGREVR